jgi:hypothetical protein
MGVVCCAAGFGATSRRVLFCPAAPAQLQNTTSAVIGLPVGVVRVRFEHEHAFVLGGLPRLQR